MEVIREVQVRSLRSHVAERRLGRLLHDVAKLARERQLSLARHQRGFGHEQLAADFGPGQPGGHANFVLLLGHAGPEAGDTQILGHLLGGDLFVEGLALGHDLARHLPAHR